MLSISLMFFSYTQYNIKKTESLLLWNKLFPEDISQRHKGHKDHKEKRGGCRTKEKPENLTLSFRTKTPKKIPRNTIIKKVKNENPSYNNFVFFVYLCDLCV